MAKTQYWVMPGKSITSLRGILGPGAEVRDGDHAQDVRSELRGKDILTTTDPNPPAPEAAPEAVEDPRAQAEGKAAGSGGPAPTPPVPPAGSKAKAK